MEAKGEEVEDISVGGVNGDFARVCEADEGEKKRREEGGERRGGRGPGNESE